MHEIKDETKDEIDEMNNMDWKYVAKYMLEQEKSVISYIKPKPINVLVTWKHQVYIAQVQRIVPEFSKEIVVLSKSTNPLPDQLVKEIRELDKERLELVADDSLDLTGRHHIVRLLVDNTLNYMTTEQTLYMQIHPFKAYELNKKY